MPGLRHAHTLQQLRIEDKIVLDDLILLFNRCSYCVALFNTFRIPFDYID